MTDHPTPLPTSRAVVRLPADTTARAQRHVTRAAQARRTPPLEQQLAEATELAAAWFTLAQIHGIDEQTLGAVGSLGSIALDAVAMRDRREETR